MTQINLDDIGKRFKLEWIFRRFSYQFEQGKSYAVLGSNGSGKSTLLQILSGSMQASEGHISYTIDGSQIDPSLFYSHVSWVSPNIDLIDDFSLAETIQFHTQFKPLLSNFDTKKTLDYMQLNYAASKPLRYFSSGMKQRVKLGLALLSQSPIILLDEPTMNLDKDAINWYLHTIEQYTKQKLLIIASNQTHEYDFCSEQIQVNNYKNEQK